MLLLPCSYTHMYTWACPCPHNHASSCFPFFLNISKDWEKGTFFCKLLDLSLNQEATFSSEPQWPQISFLRPSLWHQTYSETNRFRLGTLIFNTACEANGLFAFSFLSLLSATQSLFFTRKHRVVSSIAVLPTWIIHWLSSTHKLLERVTLKVI